MFRLRLQIRLRRVHLALRLNSLHEGVHFSVEDHFLRTRGGETRRSRGGAG